jgi:hypothetical protein
MFGSEHYTTDPGGTKLPGANQGKAYEKVGRISVKIY